MSGRKQRLQEAKEMLEMGLLSQEQYKQIQQQILTEMGVSSDSSAPIIAPKPPEVPVEIRETNRLGSYQLGSLLGEGGQGSVYLGKHLLGAKAREQGGEVAIKILHVDNSSALTRFHREATAGMELKHAGIVRVFDLVMENHQLGIVMEYIRGKTLAEKLVERQGRFSWSEIKPWIAKIGEALSYAHEQGIVHRDIKPDNIMLTADGQIKILDFGIAKLEMEGNSRTTTGVGMGTIAYMAPEQYVDVKNVDQRADIYALGMIVYELLSGRLPWENGLTDFTVLSKKNTGDLVPLSTLVNDAPSSIVKAVEQALSCDPNQRQGIVADFILDLEVEQKREQRVNSVKDGLPHHTVVFPTESPKDQQASNHNPRPEMNTVRFENPLAPNELHNAPTPPRNDGISAKENSLPAVQPVSQTSPQTETSEFNRPLFGILGVLLLGGGWFGYQKYQYNQEQEGLQTRIDAIKADADRFGVEIPSGVLSESLVNTLEEGVKEKVSIAQELQKLHTDVRIPAGTFTMGCTSEQGSDCYDSEKPTHKVEISKDFYLMESEVTQALYESVMGKNPSRFKGSNRPVEKVSWYDAVNFANKLSQQEGLEQCYQISGENVSWSNKNCNGWRLPTEAEWEYAARGGQSYKYAGSNNLDDVGWYSGNSESKTHDVCGKQKNGYGLCDMSGNVWEWVWDWYDGSFYGSHADRGTVRDPYGASGGSYRVRRGGSWGSSAGGTRVSNRFGNAPGAVNGGLGFRLGRTP